MPATKQESLKKLEVLSQREHQVFLGMANGTPPREIADTLGLSSKTVSTYRARVIKKLGITSNAQATMIAMRAKLIEEDDEE